MPRPPLTPELDKHTYMHLEYIYYPVLNSSFPLSLWTGTGPSSSERSSLPLVIDQR